MANETIINSDVPSVISCIGNDIYFAADKTEFFAKIIVAAINIVVAVFGTLANGMVMLAYYRNRRLRTIQNDIFLLLATTDIAVTVIIQPIYVVAIFSGLMGKRDCLIWEIVVVLSWLFLGLSMATIVIISWQSYITLAYPYRNQAIITKHRLKIAVFFSWLLMTAAVVKSTLLHHLSFASYLCAGVVLLTMISVLFTWVRTYKIVAKHRRIIQTSQTPTGGKLVTRKTVFRSTITALLVTLGLFLCYSLGLLLSFHAMVNVWRVEHNLLLILYPVSWTLMYSNSLLNPCLLFWRNSGFRQTARNIIV